MNLKEKLEKYLINSGVLFSHNYAKQAIEDILELTKTEEITSKLKKTIQLLRESVDDDDCQLDHHGYCQTHNWFSEVKCVNKRIQEFLEAEDK